MISAWGSEKLGREPLQYSIAHLSRKKPSLIRPGNKPDSSKITEQVGLAGGQSTTQYTKFVSPVEEGEGQSGGRDSGACVVCD